MVAASVLGTDGAIRGGSSPLSRTELKRPCAVLILGVESKMWDILREGEKTF
jgi:hypothetical protein